MAHYSKHKIFLAAILFLVASCSSAEERRDQERGIQTHTENQIPTLTEQQTDFTKSEIEKTRANLIQQFQNELEIKDQENNRKLEEIKTSNLSRSNGLEEQLESLTTENAVLTSKIETLQRVFSHDQFVTDDIKSGLDSALNIAGSQAKEFSDKTTDLEQKIQQVTLEMQDLKVKFQPIIDLISKSLNKNKFYHSQGLVELFRVQACSGLGTSGFFGITLHRHGKYIASTLWGWASNHGLGGIHYQQISSGTYPGSEIYFRFFVNDQGSLIVIGSEMDGSDIDVGVTVLTGDLDMVNTGKEGFNEYVGYKRHWTGAKPGETSIFKINKNPMGPNGVITRSVLEAL